MVCAMLATMALAPAGSNLVWSDEFDGRGLPDPAKWDYEVGRVRNNEAQYYTKARSENARLMGGRLIIEARKEPFEGAEYTSASLVTLGRFAFQYGRVEVAARLPKALGTWPAIWMMGEDRTVVGWPRCGEIDIMEHVAHNPTQIHATVHQAKDGGGFWSKGGTMKLPTYGDRFHVYAMEWSKEELKFFVDDQPYFTFPYEGPSKWTFDRRMYLLINLAIGGAWGGQKGIDAGAFPQRYEIDYVRVYQRRR